MRKKTFLSLAMGMALISGWAPAQTPVPPTPQPSPNPAKIADFEKRFAQGQQLEQDGKLAEARAIFDGILAEEPTAKGSLREAGLISVRLNEMEKADGYFDKLHELVPDYPAAVESLIQINQALKRDVKVEILLKEFRDLHAAGKVPKPYFVRERIHLDQGAEIVITQFFDYKQPPNSIWLAKMFDGSGALKRQFDLVYDPESTKEIRAKDPKLANAEQFLLVEEVLNNEQIKQVDVYNQMFALPDYKKVRNTMLAIMAGSLKPIYKQAVDTTGQ